MDKDITQIMGRQILVIEAGELENNPFGLLVVRRSNKQYCLLQGAKQTAHS